VAAVNLVLATLGSLVARVGGRSFEPGSLISRWLVGTALLPVGWILVNAYVKLADPWYVNYGRLSEVTRDS
jgi:hypothetical protein